MLPEDPPQKLLFISAGSGLTPIMSMLRYLDNADGMSDVVVLHSARHTGDVIFGPELRKLVERHEGFMLHEQLTRDHGRMGPEDLEQLCPDWREREAYLSGPSEMLDAFEAALRAARRLRSPAHGALSAQAGAGGGGDRRGRLDHFVESDRETESDGKTPILVPTRSSSVGTSLTRRTSSPRRRPRRRPAGSGMSASCPARPTSTAARSST